MTEFIKEGDKVFKITPTRKVEVKLEKLEYLKKEAEEILQAEVKRLDNEIKAVKAL